MKSLSAVPFAMLLFVVACGQDKPQPAAQKSPAPSQAVQPVPPPAPPKDSGATVVANNYSEGGYTAGVHSQSGSPSYFYFLISPESQVPVKVGSTLVFARTGPATVTRIDLGRQGSQMAVFVHVDKTLDPKGDGFPNPIRVQ